MSLWDKRAEDVAQYFKDIGAQLTEYQTVELKNALLHANAEEMKRIMENLGK